FMTQTPRPSVVSTAPASEPGMDRRPQSQGMGMDHGSAVTRFGAFLLWVLSGFGLLPLLFRRRAHRFKMEEVVIYSVHRAFFLWAAIIAGFAGSWAVRHWPVSAGVMGWVYIV